MMQPHVKHRLDQARWALIEVLKVALKDLTEPLYIPSHDKHFFVDHRGSCARFRLDDEHTPWDQMDWIRLGEVAHKLNLDTE